MLLFVTITLLAASAINANSTSRYDDEVCAFFCTYIIFRIKLYFLLLFKLFFGKFIFSTSMAQLHQQ